MPLPLVMATVLSARQPRQVPSTRRAPSAANEPASPPRQIRNRLPQPKQHDVTDRSTPTPRFRFSAFAEARQIGLGASVNGYAACRTQLLSFCR